MLMPTLTELRKAKGWSQKRLAEELGVKPNTVTRWEMDQANKNAFEPPTPVKKLLGQILECDWQDITFGEATNDQATDPA